MSAKNEKQEEEPAFDWIELHNEINASVREESTGDRMMRKFKENPFVPIGCLATTMALSYGLWSFRTGQRKMSQYMMRTRIAAQGFTVVALIVGLGLSVSKNTNENKT